MEWLAYDLLAVIGAVRDGMSVMNLMLISKSIGSLAAAGLEAGIPGGDVPTRHVWLTPMLGNPAVLSAIRNPERPGLIVIGTADPHYDATTLERLGAEPHLSVSVHEGADHSLDLDGDVDTSMVTLRAVLADIQSFAFATGLGPAAQRPDSSA